MEKKKIKLPKSVKKYIRLEKAKLRREFSDPEKLADKISELYARFGIQYK